MGVMRPWFTAACVKPRQRRMGEAGQGAQGERPVCGQVCSGGGMVRVADTEPCRGQPSDGPAASPGIPLRC